MASNGGLSPEQVANVQTIIAVGRALGANDNAIVTAIATAGVESSWLNYANANIPGSIAQPHQALGSDHDSIGLFQQRAGDYGWMPKGDLKTGMDPVHQAAAFYGGTPNATAPGLMQQQGWQTASPGTLAQQVQGSAFPGRYATFVAQAESLLKSFYQTPAIQLPFKPRATGPGYMPEAPQAAPTPAPPPPPTAGERVQQAGESQVVRANPPQNNQAPPKAQPQQRQPYVPPQPSTPPPARATKPVPVAPPKAAVPSPRPGGAGAAKAAPPPPTPPARANPATSNRRMS